MVQLTSRRGKSLHESSREIIAAVALAPWRLAWDLELAIGSRKGIAEPGQLQSPARLKLRKNVVVTARQSSARLYVFDMMQTGGSNVGSSR